MILFPSEGAVTFDLVASPTGLLPAVLSRPTMPLTPARPTIPLPRFAFCTVSAFTFVYGYRHALYGPCLFHLRHQLSTPDAVRAHAPPVHSVRDRVRCGCFPCGLRTAFPAPLLLPRLSLTHVPSGWCSDVFGALSYAPVPSSLPPRRSSSQFSVRPLPCPPGCLDLEGS